MKKYVGNAVTLFLITGAAAVFLFDSGGGNLLPKGSEAPAFELEKHGGGKFSSAELKGKVVLIDFWATWCGPCREEMPWLVTLAKEYEAKGVQFVAASHDDVEERPGNVQAYVNMLPGLKDYAAYGDPFVGGKYRVQALPTLYVIGKDGKIVAGARGATSEWRVRRWLNSALEN